MKRIIGRTIAKRYLVRDVLGRGGNAVVYEALDRHMQRPVAIKIPTVDQDDADLVLRRFQREVRASGAVVHPNVCATHESGKLEDGTPFLVMERLEGESLAERLRREGFLSLEQSVTIFSQVLSGLAAAHARRIIHRDIKPANIFLSQVEGYEDLVKILDFGASKQFGPSIDPDVEEVSQDDLTTAGFVFGTPYYMAPEQIRSLPLDARCDIFACGVVLFETLTGERLFRQQVTDEIFREVVARPARTVRSVRPSLPSEVDEVVRNALRRNPHDRYPTAAAFRKALEQLVRKASTDATELAKPRPHLTSTGENARATRLRDLKQQFHEIAEKHRATREAFEGELEARRADSSTSVPSVVPKGEDPEGTATTERKSVRRRGPTSSSKSRKRSPSRPR